MTYEQTVVLAFTFAICLANLILTIKYLSDR